MIFGAGYFEDSGDIQDHPILYFTLQGTPDDSGNFKMTKVYEHRPETIGYDIEYEFKQNENEESLEGTWINPKGQSFGNFTCKKQINISSNTRVEYCSLCKIGIESGASRWSCPLCFQWLVCQNCIVSDFAEEHDHYTQLNPVNIPSQEEEEEKQ
jgi:hypothetical protein